MVICFNLADPNDNDSVWNNPAIKVLWYLLVFILCILAIGLIIVFYFFFGASYELIKCYYDKKENPEEEEESNSYDMVNMDPSRSPPVRRNSSILSSNGEKNTSHYLIIAGLVMLGIILQPLYLMLKLVELMMECFRKFGCWFYFYGAYN